MSNSLINITTKSIGQSPAQWIKEIDKIAFWEIQNELNELGIKTHNLMIGTIKGNIKREGATGKLEDAIKFEFWNEGFKCGFWIGDVDYLNATAKQWYWLNYGYAQTGRTTPPPDKGHWEGTKWIHNSGNPEDFWMTPKKPIEPVNYIETAIFQLEQDIPAMLEKIDKELGGI